MARHIQDQTVADQMEEVVRAAMAKVLRDMAASLAPAPAKQPEVALVGKAEPRRYQVVVPGMLADAMRVSPHARSIMPVFRNETRLVRGRGTTVTFSLDGESEAAKMLDVLAETADRVNHRDIARAQAELQAALAAR
jgi:hypothetical protein